jgi:hypothetical protein
MLSRTPSVKDTYFQHKLLTQIHGKPTYESLQNGLTELKANASSVPSTLGGGQHGHLGLLLSDARYTALAHAAPFISPGNPGPFVPPAAGTGPQIEAAKDVWKQLQQTFELCQATEKALIAQIVEMVDPIYIRALLNRATGQYSSSIRELIDHLFTTYGRITPQQVKAKETELLNMHYDISQPVDHVCNCIDDLSDLADSANSPLSSQQMIDLAYVIFAKQTILQPDLPLWNRKPVADRTWENMMEHLRDAQADLSSLPIAGEMYHQAPTHQANIATMAELVTQRLLEDQRLSMPDPIPKPRMPPTQLLIEQTTAPQYTDAANSLQRRETDLQSREVNMMNQMQKMMAMMCSGGNNNNSNNSQNNGYNAQNNGYNTQNNGNHYQNNGNNSQNNGNNSQNNGNNRNWRNPNGRGGGRNSNSGGGRTNNRPRSSKQYCWTHGACVHTSANCNTPSNGHKTTATFTNMQNGSKEGCYWLT